MNHNLEITETILKLQQLFIYEKTHTHTHTVNGLEPVWKLQIKLKTHAETNAQSTISSKLSDFKYLFRKTTKQMYSQILFQQH